jgi:hypothetical protein
MSCLFPDNAFARMLKGQNKFARSFARLLKRQNQSDL